jgi:TolB-like protein
MTKRKHLLPLCMAVAVVLAGACTPQTVLLGGGATALYIFDRPDVNLNEKNYAAADYLMQAGGHFVTRNDKVKATPLQNLAEPQLSTKIGRVISQGVGERLQQLGYNVDLKDVNKAIENDFPYAANAANEEPDFVLTGTYYNAKSKLEVNLRLVDADDSRVVAQFDYKMPMSHEIQSMTKPKPRIIRTTNPQTNR